MTTDLNYLIPLAVIGFIGLIVGLLVGFMASGLRGGSKTSQQKRNRDLIEVIRIWQDRKSGNLSMEIGGKFYKEVTEFSDKSRRGFTALVNELRSWAGMAVFEQPAVESIAQPALATFKAPDLARPAESIETPYLDAPSSALELPTIPVAETGSGPQPPGAFDTLKVAELADVRPADHRSKLLDIEKSQEETAESAEQIKSIAAQVDEVLQEKLASSPLKDRSIRLMELPGGGMVVMVNNEQFDGVNEVSDPEIRNLIQESVAEWERRLDIG